MFVRGTSPASPAKKGVLWEVARAAFGVCHLRVGVGLNFWISALLMFVCRVRSGAFLKVLNWCLLKLTRVRWACGSPLSSSSIMTLETCFFPNLIFLIFHRHTHAHKLNVLSRWNIFRRHCSGHRIVERTSWQHRRNHKTTAFFRNVAFSVPRLLL